MIILGEKLNSSIPSALELFCSNDGEKIAALCRRQEECGADYLDINTALTDDETGMMISVIKIAQESTSCGIMLDSANPEVIAEASKCVELQRPLIFNSITLDERHELISLAAKRGAGIVALPMDSENGIPETPEERFENAKKLIELLETGGVARDKIFIDVIIETLAVNGEAAMCAVNTARMIRAAYPEVHLTCGLSNIAFGLPKRININTAMIPALACAGLDSAILDITSEKTRAAVIAARVLNGTDEYCMNYINEYR